MLGNKLKMNELLTENELTLMRSNSMLMKGSDLYEQGKEELTYGKSLAKVGDPKAKSEIVKDAIFGACMMNSRRDPNDQIREVRAKLSGKAEKYSKYLANDEGKIPDGSAVPEYLDSMSNKGNRKYDRVCFNIFQEISQKAYPMEDISSEQAVLGTAGAKRSSGRRSTRPSRTASFILIPKRTADKSRH